MAENQPRRGLFRRKPKDPNKPGRIKQTMQVYWMARKHFPALPWLMLAAVLGGAALGVIVGLLVDPMFLWVIFGVMFGVIGALFILGRFAESAAFEEMRGQPGAYGAVLNTVKRSWLAEEQPVAIDPRTRDLVYRATGLGGVVLLSEGPSTRVNRMLEKERKRHERVLPNVPIIVLQGGDDEGQVPMKKLVGRVRKLPKKLNKAEVLAIRKRMAALGTMSTKPPIPKGIDPNKVRPDRRAMRGR